jgi:hypothetical protein
VDNGPVWVGTGPKPQTGPNLGLCIKTHTDASFYTGWMGWGNSIRGLHDSVYAGKNKNNQRKKFANQEEKN